MTSSPSVGRRPSEQTLSRRLDALAELIRIGRARQGQGEEPPPGQGPNDEAAAGFGQTLLDDADAVLKRAGERLRLSGSHTVIALAGGTGSGKSTLFNALSGATFSPPGVTRPTTRHVHACVWGIQGAAPLLDWLNVQRRHRYARASVLDSGESDLDGLLLLDLPDHDSVVTASMAAVDRLAKLADMVIWVLDPQKYADAAVHNRYLIPLAGHASVFTVVLNQIDTLPRGADQGLRAGPAPPARRRGPDRHPGAAGIGAHRRGPRRPAGAAHPDRAAQSRGHRPDRGRHRRGDRRFRAVRGPAGRAGRGDGGRGGGGPGSGRAGRPDAELPAVGARRRR